MLSIEEIKNRIAPICQKHALSAVYLFGSYARGEATAASDIDLRIELGTPLGGFATATLYAELEDALGVTLDIMQTHQLSAEFLAFIAPDEVLIYGDKTQRAA